jgi:2-haloacid dehalogenase
MVARSRCHGARQLKRRRDRLSFQSVEPVPGEQAMDGKPLAGVAACVFDAYGTVFDFASAASCCRDVLGERTAALTALWRDKQLQYTWLRAAQGRHADFWQVTGDALDFVLDTMAIDDQKLRDRLMTLYLTLDPFPDAPDVLRRLKASGLRTAILSNGSPAMLEPVVHAAGLDTVLDAVLSVESVGVYKPHPKVYQLAVDRLATPAANIVFLSSNAWDAWAASAFGMQVVWCNRYGQRPERLPGAPNRMIKTLAELAALVGAG